MSLDAARIQASAIAHGRARKRKNALVALASGGLPAALLAILRPAAPVAWLAGLLLGLVWANAFEYVYHRWLLHVPGTLFARRHLLHHASVGTPDEAEHVNLGGTPLWIVVLFAVNGSVVIVGDLLLGLGLAPAMLLAFSAYMIAVEEVHWRIHVGGWLPALLRPARAHHLAHHDRADSRFNVFFPLFDWLLGTAKA